MCVCGQEAEVCERVCVRPVALGVDGFVMKKQAGARPGSVSMADWCQSVGGGGQYPVA